MVCNHNLIAIASPFKHFRVSKKREISTEASSNKISDYMYVIKYDENVMSARIRVIVLYI